MIVLKSPGWNSFPLRQFVLEPHPMEGFSCLPCLQLGSWRGKEGAGVALVPSDDEFHGEAWKKLCKCSLIVCLAMGLSRVGVSTNPCYADLFPLFPIGWLSLGSSYLVGSLKRLDKLLNSSSSSFLCLSCLKLSLNFFIFIHTQLLNPHRWHILCWKCIIHFSDLAAGWAPMKEINLVTELGKKGAWRCSF